LSLYGARADARRVRQRPALVSDDFKCSTAASGAESAVDLPEIRPGLRVASESAAAVAEGL
jgi:hypothetical protein